MAWRTAGPNRRLNEIVAWLVPVIFVLAALWMWLGPDGLDPVAEAAIDPEINGKILATTSFVDGQLKPGPRRIMLPDPPHAVIAGFEMGCNECHRFFESAPETPRRLTQHTHIVTNHGMNDRCFNCHDRDDRDKLVLHGGRTIGFNEVVMLCAQCHGPTYRDWERGIHGRTLNTWKTDSDAQQRLSCTECHDPHAPAYEPFHPLPGPHTLRMRDGDSHADAHTDHDHGTRRNPLRTWQHGAPATHADDDTQHDESQGHDKPESHP